MLTPRAADYLETVYLLSLSQDTVGISQVAAERGVTVPSARAAMLRLKNKGYVRQERYGKIVLTDEGRERAVQVYRKHSVIYRFLTGVLGVEPETADTEACRLEHELGPKTLSKLAGFMNAHPDLTAATREPDDGRD